MGRLTKQKKHNQKTQAWPAKIRKLPAFGVTENTSCSQHVLQGLDYTGTQSELNNLLTLLSNSAKDIHSAENQLMHSLPVMTKSENDDQLKLALHYHLTATEHHVLRLQQVFNLLDKTPQHETNFDAGGYNTLLHKRSETDAMSERTRHLDIVIAARDAHFNMSSHNFQKHNGEVTFQTAIVTENDLPTTADLPL